MSSPEVERFEITDDDYYNEFNPNRNKRKFTKHQATYGIWADEDSDENDNRPHFSGTSKSGKKDFSAPIGFVSGGIKIGDKLKFDNDTDENEQESIDVDPILSKKPKKNTKQDDFVSNKVNQTTVNFMAAGKTGTSGFGSWERHTKGIGQSLLAKMGFKPGQGLGRHEQGITAPVEAFQRKGKAALGFYGSERKLSNLKGNNVNITDTSNKQSKVKAWRKDISEIEKKINKKFQIKTIDDAISEGTKRMHFKTDISNIKVIDMTGKEQRVLSGYGAIGHKINQDEDVNMKARSFELPELINNLNVLCDSCEEEIIITDRKKRSNNDIIINLDFEYNKISNICQKEEKIIERLKDILHIIDMCTDRINDQIHPLTLKDCELVTQRLQDEYSEEYLTYDLGVYVLALVLPLFKKAMYGWQPLSDPFREGIAMYGTWRKLLTETRRRKSDTALDPYDRLVFDTWLPIVRTAITSQWIAKDIDSALALIDRWRHTLPEWILENVKEELILPKLQKAVEDWDPLSDTVPIHSWLHPWLPIMKENLKILHEPIRFKFSNALVSWHPSDPSAKFMLQPWFNVFDVGQTNAFLIKNILPKLSQCLGEMDLSPNKPKIDCWKYIIDWVELIPPQTMVVIFDRHFFPKWLNILCQWLNQQPNYDEITNWYLSWKNMFPTVLQSSQVIKDRFNTALELMNRSMNGEVVQASMTKTINPNPQKFIQNTVLKQNPNVSFSYKDLLEKRAQENNLIFIPIINKTYEAKQVYRFGRLQIYTDRGVVFVFENNVWVPTSVNNLVDKAR